MNLPDAQHHLEIAGREVRLSAVNGEALIKDSDWLVMNVVGLPTYEEAKEFGLRLKASVELAAAATRLGADVGRDLATASLAQSVKDHVFRETGAIVRDNVHGLDVFEDDPNVAFLSVSGTGTVMAKADRFLALATEIHGSAVGLSQRAQDVLLLLNFALMRSDAVAQIVFAFSAVEALGQEESWTPAQQEVLGALATAARGSSTASEDEREEIAQAIEKGLYRLSLRQGVMRLLERLGLSQLRSEWDRLYSQRSTLVHGVAPYPGATYDELAYRAMNLCGLILLRAAAREIPELDRHVEMYYQHS